MAVQSLLGACVLAPPGSYNFDRHPHHRHVRLRMTDNKKHRVSDILRDQPPRVVNEFHACRRTSGCRERNKSSPDFPPDGVHRDRGEHRRIRTDDNVAAVIANERTAYAGHRAHLVESLLQPLAPSSGNELLDVLV